MGQPPSYRGAIEIYTAPQYLVTIKGAECTTPTAEGQLTTAEMVLLQKLDLGELQQFKEARELSISLLKDWLVRYKLKDWVRTEGRGLEVTQQYKEDRAEEIAKVLSDPYPPR